MEGTRGRLERISIAGPVGPENTRTLRTATGASVVASSCGVDWAEQEATSKPASSKRAENWLRTRGKGFISDKVLTATIPPARDGEKCPGKHEGHQDAGEIRGTGRR
jgi:hypothetical protein